VAAMKLHGGACGGVFGRVRLAGFPRFADGGGVIRGPGNGTSDSILAAVTGGGIIRVCC
jgi:hypothetical protein